MGARLHIWWHYLNTWQQGWSHCSLALLIINSSDCAGRCGRAVLTAVSWDALLHPSWDALLHRCCWAYWRVPPSVSGTQGDVSLTCCLLPVPFTEGVTGDCVSQQISSFPSLWLEWERSCCSLSHSLNWGAGGRRNVCSFFPKVTK